MLIFDGDVHINGVVKDWVFAFDGDVVVDGRVNGDVTALNGRVVVTSTGSVGGDVVSGDPPVISQRTSVAGRRRPRPAGASRSAASVPSAAIVLWIAATVSSFLLGGALLLVSPRGADAVARAGRNAVGPAIGLGFAVAIGVPVVGVLLSISIVALPLGLATLFALALMYGVGYVAGCYFLGRLILKEPRNRLLAFLVGLGDPAGRGDRPGARRARRGRRHRVRPRLPDRRRVPRPPGPRRRRAAHRCRSRPAISRPADRDDQPPRSRRS